jgi:integrase
MSKRGNNEGTIAKRSDGRWVAAVSLPAGKRKYLYARTRAEVATKLANAMKAAKDGVPLPNDRITVAKYLDDWLEAVKPTLRPRTFRSYSELVRLHLSPELGKVPLAQLTPQRVQTFLNKKFDAGLSPRRVQYMHAVLRAALSRALSWGMVARNVAKLVKPPRVAREEVQPFTPEQARAFLGAVAGDRLSALFTVALALGLRQGEALGLSWADVDLDAGTLRVRFALQRVDGEYSLTEPKSKQSRRTVNLPAVAITSLREHRVRQLEERLHAGPEWRETIPGLVFTTPTGAPINGTWLTHHLGSVIARAGLPAQRFHDLRHCAASLLLAQNIPPRMVMEILGHSQISLTMNTYSHLFPAARKEAASAMDALLGT